MSRAVWTGAAARERVRRASMWLAARSEPHVTIVAASLDAAAEVARSALSLTAAIASPADAHGVRASLGWERSTLGVLAMQIAREPLARAGLVPAFGLAVEAVSARVIHDCRQRAPGSLGRFEPIGDLPGLPRALARTVTELRLCGEEATERLADPDLAELTRAFDRALESAGLADYARILRLAAEQMTRGGGRDLGAVLFVDVPLFSPAERDFVAAVARHASACLAVVPAGDDRSRARFERALETKAAAPQTTESAANAAAGAASTSALTRLQQDLFGHASASHGSPLHVGGEVEIVSAPGESRECVEIARLILAEAARGTKLDRMAVLLRAPAYGAHVEEAFRRAAIPAHFARGTRKPHAAGRAMLALLACAAEGLSARRFAEYLSLGEVPDEGEDGAPPAALAPSDRLACPEDEQALVALLGATRDASHAERAEDESPTTFTAEEDRAAPFGTLRAPRHWERLLVDASVIGGRDRWARRLEGLYEKLKADLAEYEAKAEDALADQTKRDLGGLLALRKFALPIVAELDALPSRSSASCWGDWLSALSKLATRALRHPERVLSVLAELRPMAHVGPVDIAEVRLVLERRFAALADKPSGRRYGKVFVAPIDEVRGLEFEVVFIPGLAERIFPQKVAEDPLLLDDARRALGAELQTHDDRAEAERLALRLAVGAASRRVVLSYPRIDVEQARPRTPSFYGLEVLRVAEGQLRDFHYLAERGA